MAEIRRIRVEEARAVRELVREAVAEAAERYPEERIGISERGLANLETQFRLGAVHEDEVTLVAVEEDEQIVGFVTAWVSRGRATPGVAGELERLWVRPASRNGRLGRRLAEAAVEWLRQRGARAIFRHEDARHPEREPWESLGFEADVIRFSLYGERWRGQTPDTARLDMSGV